MRKKLLFLLFILSFFTFPVFALISELEQKLTQQGLVDITSLNSEILVEMKYSTPDNFMKKDVYGDFHSCYLQKEVAQMFSKAAKALQKNHPGYRFLAYDCARPRSVQRVMWSLVKGTPDQGYVADPEKGSIHNYGSAVDLTVVDEKGAPLDMGTPYDFFGDLAQPRYEAKFLKSGELTKEQIAHRMILRETMTGAGFRMIRNEWWHFDAFSREEAKKRFSIVE